jgi:ketosteroid isomerase-like protein
MQEDARALIREWAAAQNHGDFAAYSRLYADPFTGVRRTPNGKELRFERAAWLTDRERIFAKPMAVVVEELLVVVYAGDEAATATFVQRFRRGKYADHGRKRMRLERHGEALLIAEEEMLESAPGWATTLAGDDGCDMDFDPSGHAFLVALQRFDDYGEALAATLRQRRAHRKAEIVRGADFGIDPGFWVLAGASDDQAEADALAARVQGSVADVSAALAQAKPDRVRLVAHDDRPSGVVTVVGDVAYVVGLSDDTVTAIALGEANRPHQRFISKTGIYPVRAAAHGGQPFVLDHQGHWHHIGVDALEDATPFDPDPAEGKEATIGAQRFILGDGEYRLRDRLQVEDLATHETSTVLSEDSSPLFKLSKDRLALIDDGDIYVFAVGPMAPRLTKICGRVTSDERLVGSAKITIHDLELAADRKGRFEIWTSEWGFARPTVSNVYEVVNCGEASHEEVDSSMVPLFHQPSQHIKVVITCQDDGGC